MTELFVAVYGTSATDEAKLCEELSGIFGAPVEAEATLSGVGDALGFIVELAATNLTEVVKKLVALVRNIVGSRIEIHTSNGGTFVFDSKVPISVEEAILLLKAAKEPGAPPKEGG